MSDIKVLTGPTRRTLTLQDGTVYDCSPDVVDVQSQAHAEELMHLIGETYAADGHPSHVEVDDETGELVQRPFRHDPAKAFKNYKPHADNRHLKG